jgi:hypothetical protein
VNFLFGAFIPLKNAQDDVFVVLQRSRLPLDVNVALPPSPAPSGVATQGPTRQDLRCRQLHVTILCPPFASVVSGMSDGGAPSRDAARGYRCPPTRIGHTQRGLGGWLRLHETF